MRVVSWLVGLLSGICITSAILVFGQLHFYKVEVDALKDDITLQQTAGRDEIEAIRTQFSRALRLCNAKLETPKAVK